MLIHFEKRQKVEILSVLIQLHVYYPELFGISPFTYTIIQRVPHDQTEN